MPLVARRRYKRQGSYNVFLGLGLSLDVLRCTQYIHLRSETINAPKGDARELGEIIEPQALLHSAQPGGYPAQYPEPSPQSTELDAAGIKSFLIPPLTASLPEGQTCNSILLHLLRTSASAVFQFLAPLCQILLNLLLSLISGVLNRLL